MADLELTHIRCTFFNAAAATLRRTRTPREPAVIRSYQFHRSRVKFDRNRLAEHPN